MASVIEEPGLRERKRTATRRAIQVAALQLVVDAGIEVTVEEISRRADISPRTFFNYFPSKEAALVGDAPSLPNAEVRGIFVNAGPDESVYDGVATMMVASTDASSINADVAHLRRQVLKLYPHLAASRMAYTRSFEEGIAEIVLARLIADDPAMDSARARSRAWLITLTIFGVMRHAWMSWAEGSRSITLREYITESFAEARELLQQKSPQH